MKKKLLFAAYSLDIGGIETALVSLLNELSKYDYDITLVLEKKHGIFLKDVSDRVNIIEYTPSYCKAKITAKFINVIKRLNFMRKYKNKFDCAVSYATYSLSSSFIARTASQNNVLWVHSEYLDAFKNDEEEYKNFFFGVKAHLFKQVVFVSESMRLTFESILGNCMDNKRITINNLINYEEILKKSDETILDVSKSDATTFLYVGRLTEYDKKLSRLFNACELLKNEKCNYRLLLVGDGEDRAKYENMVESKFLEKYVTFLGKKDNPYPYFKMADCLVLTSEYEGFPVVYNEARLLNVPIITTDVSDSRSVIDNKYGIVVNKDDVAIFNAMKSVVKNGFKISERFDAKKYNEGSINQLIEIFNR